VKAKRFSLSALLAICATCMLATSPAKATTYTFVDLGPGPKGAVADVLSTAYAANTSYLGGAFVYNRGSCGKACSFNIYHAAAWPRSGQAPVDITPPLINFAEAWVYGGAGNVFVGYGVTDNGGYYGYAHALVWQGTNFAWKDINPIGDTVSYAYATNGTLLVGSGESSALHALVWSLTNLSKPTDLHPGTKYTQSEALGLYGSRQVGYAVTNSMTPTQHAMIWNGTAASAIDLTPPGVTAAYAYATGSVQQVGCGVVAPNVASHALLWRGTAASTRDLNPLGFVDSCARAIRNGIIAGYGHNSGRVMNALVWTGTAASAVDLQSVMPSTYVESQAYSFDASGNIIGSALYEAPTGVAWHTIVWMPH
jgi:hypothetical protein